MQLKETPQYAWGSLLYVSKRKKEQISNKVVQNIFHCCKVLFINAVSAVNKTCFLLYQENANSIMSRPFALISCKC